VNVDIVRNGSAAFFASGDTSSLTEGFVWDLTNFEGWPDKAVYTGLDELNQFMTSWFEPFEDWRQEFDRLEDVGEDRVLGILHQHARLKGSSAEIDMRYAIVYTVVGGLAARADVYMPIERAFEAVGLAERSAG
jgi:SnoaL-like domain